MRPRPPAKPPVFRLPTATVYSCGYRHLGLDWSTDKDIDELSQELMSALGKKLIVVMECLMFHDRPRSCPGVNGEVMHRVADASDRFTEWMRATKANIMRLMHLKRVDNPGGVPNLEIVMVCRSGKHRSVACAELTAFVLEQLGWTVDVEHIHNFKWGKCKGGCKRCQMCDYLKRDAFKIALTTWQSV